MRAIVSAPQPGVDRGGTAIRNLVQRPRAESTWVFQAGNGAQTFTYNSTGGGPDGTHAYNRYTITTQPTSGTIVVRAGAGSVLTHPGRTYTVSMFIRANTSLAVRWYIDSATLPSGSYVSTINTPAETIGGSNNTWVRLVSTVTIPNTATIGQSTFYVQFLTLSQLVVGTTIDVAAAAIYENTTCGEYYDGDSPGWRWTGTNLLSVSVGPIPRFRNLAINPRFTGSNSGHGTNTNFWDKSVDTTYYRSSPQAVRHTRSSVAGANPACLSMYSVGGSGTAITVVAGRTYTISTWIRAGQPGYRARVFIGPKTANMVDVGTSLYGPYVDAPAGAWVKVSGTFTMPAGTYLSHILAEVSNTDGASAATGHFATLDDTVIYEGTDDADFDPDSVIFTGAANNSASVFDAPFSLDSIAGPPLVRYDARYPYRPVLDTFSREGTLNGSTSDSGHVWAATFGGTSISVTGGEARIAETSGAYSTLDTQGTDGDVSATFRMIGVTGMAFRVTDGNNYLQVRYVSTRSIEIWKVVGNVSTNLGSTALAADAPAYNSGGTVTLRARLVGDQVWYRAEWATGQSAWLLYTITDAILRTGTRAGIRGYTGAITTVAVTEFRAAMRPANGSALAKWENLASPQYDLTQATANRKPTYWSRDPDLLPTATRRLVDMTQWVAGSGAPTLSASPASPSLRVTVTNTNLAYWLHAGTYPTVIPGETYTLKVRVRTISRVGTGGVFVPKIIWSTSGGGYVTETGGSSISVAAVGSAIETSVQLTAPADQPTAVRARLYLQLAGMTIGDVFDVELVSMRLWALNPEPAIGPMVQFDGSLSYMAVASVPIPQAATLYMVVQQAKDLDATYVENRLFSLRGNGSGNIGEGPWLRVRWEGSSQVVAALSKNSDGTFPLSYGSAITNTRAHVISGVFPPGSPIVAAVDGVATVGTQPYTVNSPSYLGTIEMAPFSFTKANMICATLLYPVAHSAATRNRIEKWLGYQYGVAVS